MPTLIDYVFGFFQNYQGNVQDSDNASPSVIRFWPRKLNYTIGSDCNDDEAKEDECDVICDDEEDNQEDQCEIEELNRGEDGEDGEEDTCPCEPSRFARKMKLVSRAAKYGMKEGALCGIFFGGGWGIYKWIDIKYLNKQGGEGGSDEGAEDDGSTTNNNLIFVTAFNSAITMGIICTFICCTKAIMCCS